MKTLLAEHVEKPEIMKYCTYRALFDTPVGKIADAMDLEEPYSQTLFISETVERFLNNGKDGLLQT